MTKIDAFQFQVQKRPRARKPKRITTRALLNAIKECTNKDGGSIAEIKRKLNKNIEKEKDMAVASDVKMAISRAVKSGHLKPPRKGWQGFRGMESKPGPGAKKDGAKRGPGAKGAPAKKRGRPAKDANKSANKSENYNPMEEDSENTNKSLLSHFTNACAIM